MKVDTYNLKTNKPEGKIELPEAVFAEKWNPDLVHQVVLAIQANSREPIAHAKGRGEVRGGGKKPWRQKGTGRARHGSSRSPIWSGGGVTFGPQNDKNYTQKVNKKMRVVALFSVLSKKLKDGEIKFFEEFSEAEAKNLRNEAKSKEVKTILLIPEFQNKKIKPIVRNSEKLDAMSPKSLNVYDVLKFKNIFIEKGAVAEIEAQYSFRKQA